MIHRLNEQVLGSPENDIKSTRNKDIAQRRSSTSSDSQAHHQPLPTQSLMESAATTSLRSLVEETAISSPSQVPSSDSLPRGMSKPQCRDDDCSSSDDGNDSVGVVSETVAPPEADSSSVKRPATTMTSLEEGGGSPHKRARTSTSV
jgi:hypothetical protein